MFEKFPNKTSRENQRVSNACECSVPWFPLTSSASPTLPTCTDRIWPLLPSPSPALPPDAIISHWMTLNWSPCSCPWPSRSSSYRAARASFKQHQSDRTCKIASNISFTSSDDLQLLHAIFLKKNLGELLASLANDDPRAHLLDVGFAFMLLLWKLKQRNCFSKHYKFMAICVIINV